jgi:hypothetical protein
MNPNILCTFSLLLQLYQSSIEIVANSTANEQSMQIMTNYSVQTGMNSNILFAIIQLYQSSIGNVHTRTFDERNIDMISSISTPTGMKYNI